MILIVFKNVNMDLDMFGEPEGKLGGRNSGLQGRGSSHINHEMVGGGDFNLPLKK